MTNNKASLGPDDEEFSTLRKVVLTVSQSDRWPLVVFDQGIGMIKLKLYYYQFSRKGKDGLEVGESGTGRLIRRQF